MNYLTMGSNALYVPISPLACSGNATFNCSGTFNYCSGTLDPPSPPSRPQPPPPPPCTCLGAVLELFNG